MHKFQHCAGDVHVYVRTGTCSAGGGAPPPPRPPRTSPGSRPWRRRMSRTGRRSPTGLGVWAGRRQVIGFLACSVQPCFVRIGNSYFQNFMRWILKKSCVRIPTGRGLTCAGLSPGVSARRGRHSPGRAAGSNTPG